jgi:predicted GH43/DUF377 family glycosyl hydrolase
VVDISRRNYLNGLGTLLAGAACDLAPGFALAARETFRTPYKYNRLVLSRSADPHSFDSKSVDDPVVFAEDGRFYMTYVGYDGMGYQVGLAESDDLLNWHKLGKILGRDPGSSYLRYSVALGSILCDAKISSSIRLKKVNGRWVGVWHAYPNPGYEEGAAVIGLAWSQNLKQWEVSEPILRPEEGALWERGGLYKAYLLEWDGRYYIYYNAKNRTEWPWLEQTGVAISPDLKVWTRFSENPILRNGGKGSYDAVFASNPFVVHDQKTWALFYYGLARDGHARELMATGQGPLHFKKQDEVLIGPGAPGSIDAQHAHKPSVMWWRGDMYHFYCAVSDNATGANRGISVARSRPW